MGKKQTPEDEPKETPSRTDQARQVVEEYANDQRELHQEAPQAGQLKVRLSDGVVHSRISYSKATPSGSFSTNQVSAASAFAKTLR